MSIRSALCASISLILAAICGAPTPAYAAAPLALESSTGMVVSAQHMATDVGADILRRGGNAVDAAVAVGYALAVTHPCCGNLGGGGFMTIHFADGRNTFLNFREKAPLAARADAKQAKALGFPRPGILYGASDSRAPAGSAAAP